VFDPDRRGIDRGDAEVGALLKIHDLQIQFQDKTAVNGVSLRIDAGQAVGLVGASGSGKSLTGLAVMGLLPNSANVKGLIQFHDEDLLKMPEKKRAALRGRKIAMIFQEPMTSLNPVMTVMDQIAEVLIQHEELSKTEARARAATLLDEVGVSLGERRDTTYAHELSGGQRQRVMIAMAIACKPELLIADEPTTALDVTVQKQILELLLSLRAKYKMALLFITHDLSLIRRVTEVIYVMSSGSIVETGETPAVFAHPREHATRELLTIDEVKRSPSPKATELIAVKDLHVSYEARSPWSASRAVKAVDGVSFSVQRGRTLAVVGESGSGKTSVGRALLQLLTSQAGEIFYDGVEPAKLDAAALRKWRRQAQIIFQDPYSSLNPRQTLEKALTEPMAVHGIGASISERRERAAALLRRVGLDPARLSSYPHEFSGGERQRLCIARALSVGPEFLVCDEAVSALDGSARRQVLDLLADLQKEMGLTYLFITHDLRVVRAMADEVVVMRSGKIIERGETAALFAEPREAYTRELLAAALY